LFAEGSIYGEPLLQQAARKNVSWSMSVLVEVIVAVVQGALEAVGDLLLHRNSGDNQDEE